MDQVVDGEYGDDAAALLPHVLLYVRPLRPLDHRTLLQPGQGLPVWLAAKCPIVWSSVVHHGVQSTLVQHEWFFVLVRSILFSHLYYICTKKKQQLFELEVSLLKPSLAALALSPGLARSPVG